MSIRVLFAACAALLISQGCADAPSKPQTAANPAKSAAPKADEALPELPIQSEPVQSDAPQKEEAAASEPAKDEAALNEPAQNEFPVDESQLQTTGTEAESKVAVQVLNWEQTAKLVGSKKGKVVVVDFWATYCPPCVKEFPNLVKLHKKHGDKIACVSVSADYEGDNIAPLKEVQGPVLEQLEKFGATFDNVLLSITSEELNKKIGVTSVPVVMVFNKAGKRIAMFPDPKNPDEFTYAKDIIPIIEKALAE